MNRLATLLITSASCAAFVAAQTPPSPDNRTTGPAGSNTDTRATAAPGSTISTTLTKSLDSKKVKEGDPVIVRTIEPVKKNGQTVIPSGATIEGHVTQASAKQSGDAYSSLGIVFDKAVLKNGEEIDGERIRFKCGFCDHAALAYGVTAKMHYVYGWD